LRIRSRPHLETAVRGARGIVVVFACFAIAAMIDYWLPEPWASPAATITLLVLCVPISRVTRLPFNGALRPLAVRRHRDFGVAGQAATLILFVIPPAFAWAYIEWAALHRSYQVPPWGQRQLHLASIPIAMTALLFSPILEEYLFRWVLVAQFRMLYRSTVVAIIASAIWFAFIHPTGVMPIALVLAICSSCIVLLTGSIRLSVFLHMAVNGTLTVAAYIGTAAAR
jgi:membrane protease YdiL (CAAX protease family)